MCPILTGHSICVLFSQGQSYVYVSYSHRAKHMCLILTRDNHMCPIFLGSNFPAFFRRHLCPIIASFRHVCPISRMCPIFQMEHICISLSSNRTHMDVTLTS